MTRLRFFVLFAVMLLLVPFLLTGCGKGEPVPYERAHDHVYGNWYDAAPTQENTPVTEQVRYCKICRAEEIREKE